jgi:hypothetical protein
VSKLQFYQILESLHTFFQFNFVMFSIERGLIIESWKVFYNRMLKRPVVDIFAPAFEAITDYQSVCYRVKVDYTALAWVPVNLGRAFEKASICWLKAKDDFAGDVEGIAELPDGCYSHPAVLLWTEGFGAKATIFLVGAFGSAQLEVKRRGLWTGSSNDYF